VQREFGARFKKRTLFLRDAPFVNRSWNSRCTVITELDIYIALYLQIKEPPFSKHLLFTEILS
jgi:hypothetical protein